MRRLLSLLVLLTWSTSASGASYTVGNDPGCDFSTLDAAINAAQNDGDPAAEIRLATSQTYTAIQAEIVDHAMHIRGGYSVCLDPLPSRRTVLRGTGGDPRPVLLIHSSTPGVTVTLEDLGIRNGDPGPGKYGGGLAITGGACVSLVNVSVSFNTAERGGGIYLDGANGARLLTDADTQIFSNTATDFGGGIYCEDALLLPSRLMVRGNVFGNTALDGGGVYVDRCAYDHYALTVGDGVFFNEALRDGGGIYARNHSQVVLTGTAAHSLIVSINTAGDDGGGAFIESDTNMRATRVAFDDNGAGGDGGGVYVENGQFLMYPLGICTDHCSRMEDNAASGAGGAIYQTGSIVTVERTWLMDNSSPDGSVIKSEGDRATFESVVVAGNRNATSVMRLKNGLYTISGATFADNEDMNDTLLLTSTEFYFIGNVV